MKRTNYTPLLNELSASERIFTTAQAERLGIPRNVLAKACEAGKLVRIRHGAYRLAGVPAAESDELEALWKTTNAEAFTHERAGQGSWDGVCVGGTTAASLLGLGDFYLSPYRIYAPKRLRSHDAAACFAVRRVSRDDVSFAEGFAITRIERTLFDLVYDHEDPSLVKAAFADARKIGFDEERLAWLIDNSYTPLKTADGMTILFREEWL